MIALVNAVGELKLFNHVEKSMFITNRKDQDWGNNAITCLEEVTKTVSELQTHLGSSNVGSFVTTDVGTYGSGTFEYTLKRTDTSRSVYNTVVDQTKNFVEKLYRDSWTFGDWEKNFLTIPGLLKDRGYIAALQRTIASKADCLILMGGGHFQHIAT